MPNHVNNHLLVEGRESDIAAFFAKAAGKNHDGGDSIFTFNAFIPMPDTVFRGSIGKREELEFPGDSNWYEWSKKHWGTKWDCYQKEIVPPLAHFQTAWNVPRPVLLEMSRQFPSLVFTNEWIEETLESAGVLILRNNIILIDAYESSDAWDSKASKYIHPLNMKYNKDWYLSYLEECAEDQGEDSIYRYYAQATKMVCAGCRNYFGKNEIVCAIHPYGITTNTCSDWASA